MASKYRKSDGSLVRIKSQQPHSDPFDSNKTNATFIHSYYGEHKNPKHQRQKGPDFGKFVPRSNCMYYLSEAREQIVDPAKTGVYDQGFGLACSKRNFTSAKLNDSSSSPSVLNDKSYATQFHKQIGRDDVDVDGRSRSLSQSRMTASREEIMKMEPLDEVSFLDYLPNSILRKMKK